MKEATGELNMTLVVLVIVGVLASFFFGVLWPRIHDGFYRNTKCDEAICLPENRRSDGGVNCTYKDKNGKKQTIVCPWKG